jgi:hypothetical protein
VEGSSYDKGRAIRQLKRVAWEMRKVKEARIANGNILPEETDSGR